jgi:hypothetical protein
MNKEELTERIKNLKGNLLSLKNQSINYITSQQYKLKVDSENWNNQEHASLDQDQIDNVVHGFAKRDRLLEYIYNKLK